MDTYDTRPELRNFSCRNKYWRKSPTDRPHQILSVSPGSSNGSSGNDWNEGRKERQGDDRSLVIRNNPASPLGKVTILKNPNPFSTTDGEGRRQDGPSFGVDVVAKRPQHLHLDVRHRFAGDGFPLDKSPTDDKEERQIYSRDYLLELRKLPPCLARPKNLPTIPGIILCKPVLTSTSTFALSPQLLPQPPSLCRSISQEQTPRKSSKRRRTAKLSSPSASSSSSSSGVRNKNRHPEFPRKIINLNLDGEVKLRTSENAWKSLSVRRGFPPRLQEDVAELSQRLRGLLNKLSAGNFEVVSNQIARLNILNEDVMKMCINIIFEKAILEPNFSGLYAALAKKFSRWTVRASGGELRGFVCFKDLIITRCQHEFEKDKYGDYDNDLSTPTFETCPTEKGEEAAKKKRTLGNIRFIGELYMQDMLQEMAIHQCIVDLLRFRQDEDRLESLCKLLTVVGRKIDFIKSKPRIDQYFKRIYDILNKKQISSRIKFMLKDILELRENEWVPRHSCPNQQVVGRSSSSTFDDLDVVGSSFRKSLSNNKSVEENNKACSTLPRNFSFSHKQPGRPSKFLAARGSTWDKNVSTVVDRNLSRVMSKEFSSCINSLVSPTEVNIQTLGSRADDELKREPPTARRGRTTPNGVNRNSKDLSPERLERKCITFLDEYLNIEDQEEVAAFLEETKDVHSKCCKLLIVRCLEKNSLDRPKLGDLFAFALTNDHLSVSAFVQSLKEILDLSEDLEIDVPKVWEYVAEILFPVLLINPADVTNRIFRKDFAASDNHARILTKILSNTLKSVEERKGHEEAERLSANVERANWVCRVDDDKLSGASETEPTAFDSNSKEMSGEMESQESAELSPGGLRSKAASIGLPENSVDVPDDARPVDQGALQDPGEALVEEVAGEPET